MLVALLEDHLRRYQAQFEHVLTDSTFGFEARWESNISLHDRDNVEALVRGSHDVNADTIRRWKGRYPRLRMLSLAFTGHDEVDTAAVRRAGLAACFVPGYSTNSVAELAVCLALAVSRKLSWGDHSIRRGTFDEGDAFPGLDLAGATVGIVGTGTIGIATAKKFRGLGCELLGWTRPTTGPERRARFEAIGGVYSNDLDDLFRSADVITLHLALSSNTRHIVNDRRIALMRPTSILVNTARAGLVDTDALAEALAEGRIHGAGIDVFEHEPIGPDAVPTHPLLRLDPTRSNLVVTPHLGFKTGPSLETLAQVSLQNIRDFADGIMSNALVQPIPTPPRPAETDRDASDADTFS